MPEASGQPRRPQHAAPALIVTRPASEIPRIVDLLAARGFTSLPVPTVSIEPVPAGGELDRALARLAGTDWLVLTSANGARAVIERRDARAWSLPATTRVAAVGPATAAVLREAGLRVDHVPQRYLTVAIAAGLGDIAGRRVLLARADSATADLRVELVRRGARVSEVVAYRTVEAPVGSRALLDQALASDPQGIVFTSGSTVRGAVRLARPAIRESLLSLPALCIGPVTADVARGVGFRVIAVADEHTSAGLAATIGRAYAHGGPGWQ